MVLSLFVGCAAQNANQHYFEADTLLKDAMTRVGSNDPNANLAFDSLAKGKTELMEARYDKAIRLFRDSMRISRQIINGTLSATPVAIAPTPSPSVVPISTPIPPVVVAPTEAPVSGPNVIDPGVVLRDDLPEPVAKPDPKEVEAKKGLPQGALAKYLASKKAAPKLEKPPPAKEAVPATTKMPAPTPVPLQTEGHRQTLDEKPIATNEIVIAPATPGLKPVPKIPEHEATAEAQPAEDSKEKSTIKELYPKAKIPAAAKRRVPDAVPFVQDDASVVPDAMSTLNQTAKFLLENPSTTLLLQAQLSPHEARNLADERFQSIKAYLIGKGVPEDQIQMDDMQKRGKNSEFQMYLVEH